MSLRGRLLALLLVLVTLGLVVSDVATYTVLKRFLVHRIDQQLNAARGVELAVQYPDRIRSVGEGLGNRSDVYIQIRDPGGTIISAIPSARSTASAPPRIPQRLPHVEVDPITRPAAPTPAPVPVPAPGTTTPTTPARANPFVLPPAGRGTTAYLTVGSVGHGSSWRIRVARVPNGDTVIVGLPMNEVVANLDYLKWIEIAVTGGVVLVTAAVGLWVVRLGLRPLDAIEDTADDIAAGDLTRRVPEAAPRTEVGRLARALNAMLSQIERAFNERQASEERLRRFVADASHELRTPLTSIRGYAELFRRGADHRPEDLAKTMRSIEQEATRMGVLVDDLLLLARLDQGRPIERHPVELTRLAHQAVDAAEIIDGRHPLTIASNGPVWVIGDPARLRQVVDNLLANVRTHTAPGTPATVRVLEREGQAVVEISDQGPGLTADQAARAFERFYRADPSRSRDRGGSGLGLAIVDSIVTAHGGRVGVATETGHGATFRIWLPLQHRDAATPVKLAGLTPKSG